MINTTPDSHHRLETDLPRQISPKTSLEPLRLEVVVEAVIAGECLDLLDIKYIFFFQPQIFFPPTYLSAGKLGDAGESGQVHVLVVQHEQVDSDLRKRV